MGEIIKGKPVAEHISADLAREVQGLKLRGIVPGLTIIRVGARGDDLAYERGALKRCEQIGLAVRVCELPENISQEIFIKALEGINQDPGTHGILLFRPLPGQLDEGVIKHVIRPEKDVDCFSPVNVAKLVEGDPSGFPPCTPTAVMEMLKFYKVPLKGRRAAVLGRSMVVGKPVAFLLLSEDATVTICHSRTLDLAQEMARADIIVAAVGRARMVKRDFVKPGAVVVDVGINVDERGELCGDVDFEGCLDRVSMITPVPGGVGSVTTSVLAKHVVKACRQQTGILE